MKEHEDKNNTENALNNSGGCLGVIFFLVVFIGGGIWGFSKATEWYYNREQAPFWKGTDLVQVCKTPYYSSEDCYKLNATLIDNKTVRIHLPNGGYKTTYKLTCYFAAARLEDQPRFVFCSSWDSDNERWDFMPAWAYYPSIEDMQKQ